MPIEASEICNPGVLRTNSRSFEGTNAMNEDPQLRIVLEQALKRCRAVFPDREITAESSITRDLGLDSLQALELISDIESDVGISIPSELLPQADTVRDLAEMIVRLRAEKGE